MADPSRRVAYDVFHGDPFKINSYSFRYADKPSFTPQHYQRPAPTPPSPPAPNRTSSFQTFFVNPNFNRSSELPPSNRGVSRPHFLREFQPGFTTPLRTMAPSMARQPSVPVSPQLRCPPGVTDSPLLRTCCQMGQYQSLRGGQSSATLGSASSCSMRATGGGGAPCISNTTFSRSSNVQLHSNRDREASSGCEININICSRDLVSEADNNVNIRIEADSCLLNNTDTVRPELERNPQRSDDSLTASFGIDKRLSKFNVTETKPRTSPEWERQQRELQQRVQARERDRQFREELELERERELQKERDLARQRNREREQLRQQERQRDLEHLQLEAVRERQRLEELKRESHWHREYQRMCIFQDQLYRQRMQSMPVVPPVTMTSHLYTVTSDDRLPGMAFCGFSSRRPTTTRRSVTVKKADPVVQEIPTASAPSSALVETSVPTPSCSTIPPSSSPDQNGNPTLALDEPTGSRSEKAPAIPGNLKCSSSFSSNDNVHIIEKSSGSLAKGSPAQSQTEAKQLNGRPPIVTRLNNIPIRITTSRNVDTNLDLSMSRVRVRGSSPVTRGAGSSRRDCHVNINLFPEKLRMSRI
ncbi:hypothetical protein KR059_005468 [Drosophila kikkawai]|nr:hypothetical protein KR059_005468 [Drosophila kikkawai]